MDFNTAKKEIQSATFDRDGNKAADQEEKDKILTEDQRDEGKKDIDELTKKYIARVDELLEAKTTEIMQV